MLPETPILDSEAAGAAPNATPIVEVMAMFEDMWRFDTPFFGDFAWVRGLLDDLASPAYGISDLRSVPRGTFPAVNVGETEDSVFVYAFLPGVDARSVDVSVEGSLLTLSGTREGPEAPRDATWYRNERFSGEFTRSFSLPETVDPDQVEARLKDGVLAVRMKKRAEMQPRRLEVKTA